MGLGFDHKKWIVGKLRNQVSGFFDALGSSDQQRRLGVSTLISQKVSLEDLLCRYICLKDGISTKDSTPEQRKAYAVNKMNDPMVQIASRVVTERDLWTILPVWVEEEVAKQGQLGLEWKVLQLNVIKQYFGGK